MASTKSSEKKSVFDVDESSMRFNKADQVFEVKSGKGFEFVVVDQRYHNTGVK